LVVFDAHGGRHLKWSKKDGKRHYHYILSAGVALITTGPTTLKSIAFDFVPYSITGVPLPQKVTRFTEKKPLLPNRVYKFEGKLVGPEVVWHDKPSYSCLRLVDMVIRSTDDTITRVNKQNIDHYVTSHVAAPCVEPPPAIGPIYRSGLVP
jgi:hypothetical protein